MQTVRKFHNRNSSDGEDDSKPVSRAPLHENLQPDEEDWRNKVKLKHLNDETFSRRVIEMLENHQQMWRPGYLGEINATEHRIELKPGTKPIRQLPYHQGLHKRKVKDAAIKEMLKQGVIEEANTEWPSPVVLAPKSDGSHRFFAYYRRLNAATIADFYPLLRAGDCLDSLGEATIFKTLDCNSGYWQMNLAEEDKDKTMLSLTWARIGIYDCRLCYAMRQHLSSELWT